MESFKFGRSAAMEGNLAPLEGTLTRSSRDFGLSLESEEVPRHRRGAAGGGDQPAAGPVAKLGQRKGQRRDHLDR